MEWKSGNVFIREMRFVKAGDIINGHAHNFPHTTYVSRGALLVELLEPSGFETVPSTDPDAGDGAVEQRAIDWRVVKSVTKRATDGFNWILIEAGKRHRITALEDNSMGHCIYAHRNPQGEVVQEYDGWTPGYV